MKNTPPLGPAPTPPPAGGAEPHLDPARRRVLEAIPSTGGLTIADLVEALGGHPNTARHHVAALVASGLVAEALVPPTGRKGRPAIRFVTTTAGRAARRPGQGMADEYIALAVAFADRLAANGGDPGGDARAVGRVWGSGLVRREAGREDPANEVVGLLDDLGFSPDRATPGTQRVLLRTCPLLDAARRHPEVVCAVHRGLAEAAYEAFGGGAREVALEPFALPGSCVLTLPEAPAPLER